MIAIIDYKAGNIASVKNALARLGVTCIVTSKPQKILSAKGVILPGQGRAGEAILNLKKTGIDKIIPQITKPFLGICLGMQLLSCYSEEDKTKCLCVFQGQCRKFPLTLKTPHLGWNKVALTRKSPLIAGIPNRSYFYFVHSYYVDPVGKNIKNSCGFVSYHAGISNGVDASQNQIIGKTSYGFDFASIMQKDNFFAVQFHPEKSDVHGLRLLNNFLKLCL